MEVAYALLADSGNVTANGKLNLLGAFNVIYARRFPAYHPAMVLAFSFRAEYEDRSKVHKVELTLIDEDGQQLLRWDAEVEVGPLAPGQFAQLPQIIGMNGLRIPKAGRYRFNIHIVGREGPVSVVFMAAQLPGD